MSAPIDSRPAQSAVPAPVDHERHVRVHHEKQKHVAKGASQQKSSYKAKKPESVSVRVQQYREDLQREFGIDDPDDHDSQAHQPASTPTGDAKVQAKLFSSRSPAQQQPEPGTPKHKGLGSSRQSSVGASLEAAAGAPASSVPDLSNFNIGIAMLMMGLDSMSIQQTTIKQYTISMDARTYQAKLVQAGIAAMQNSDMNPDDSKYNQLAPIDFGPLSPGPDGQPFTWPAGAWNPDNGLPDKGPPAGTQDSVVTQHFLQYVLNIGAAGNAPTVNDPTAGTTPVITVGTGTDAQISVTGTQLKAWIDQQQTTAGELTASNSKDGLDMQEAVGEYQNEVTQVAQIQEKCFTTKSTVISKM
ncbi:hypothetical protein QS306_09140 [Paraburkholderia bonniea]|uniref:hypothetical protein n=1 Tax=Paraburkholderia bonniea TaxID=2152891 RepID=UPI0025729835|nr:hypothetical protein [Paraburkholderia bonniea]WJF89287.1 hypothetical protein QS306_09140 [Paraburkholderia bonniea]WJF92603.1 hypothetical protein QS308_09150 [Paraburkholderia bonniea]